MATPALPVVKAQPQAQAQADTLLRFEDVSMSFEQPVLEAVSFQLARGDTKVLLGEAGTG